MKFIRRALIVAALIVAAVTAGHASSASAEELCVRTPDSGEIIVGRWVCVHLP